MKIIHTSDWHLGHSLYGYNRDEEQASMLSQLEEIVRTHSPDALVVSGDIYHTGQPSAAVQKLFTEAVMRICAACPGLVTVITAGNHDSASRHEVSRILWETQGVHMIGQADNGNPGAQIVEVPGKGYIAAVPYLPERKISEGFFGSLLDSVAERNAAGLPVVLSAHLAVGGSDFTGHDCAAGRMVGGMDCIDIGELGSGYDYAALGHIHRAQTLRGSGGRVRYSGAPVPVSFDEVYPHSVTLAEISGRGALPKITEIPIENPRPLVNLPSSGFARWEEVRALAADFPRDNPAYIRLNVEVDDFLPPDAKAAALSALSGGMARFCIINVRKSGGGSGGGKTMSVSEFRAADPLDVVRLFAKDSGFELTPELESLFTEAEEEVRRGL